jgi:hypothetical protein
MLISCLRCAGDDDWLEGLGRQCSVPALSYGDDVQREFCILFSTAVPSALTGAFSY